MIIAVKLPVSGNSSGYCISIDKGTTYHPMVHTNNSIITTHFNQNTILLLMYDGSTKASVYGSSSGATSTSSQNITGVWRVMNLREDGNTYTSAYCSTRATIAAKTATSHGYVINNNQKHYIHIIITNTNTAQSALTLNINGQGAKPIYINGTASSSSNYNLTRGSYLAYYDGTNYHFRTDGKLQGSLAGNADTATNFNSARTIALTGDVTGSASSNGASGWSIVTTVGNDSHTHSYIIDNGNHTEAASGTTANAPTTGMLKTSGLYMTRTYNDSNTPASYGNVINLAGTGTGQLLCEWKGTDNTPGHLYYRSHRNTSTGGWSPWITILDSDNYTSYTVTKTGSGASGTWGIGISGNAATATKATQDSAGQQINKTYIKGLSVSGKTITYTKGDGSTGTIATQDLNTRQTLYSSNYNLPLLMSYQTNTNTTANIDNITFRNNNIYANPSTGMIASTSSKIGEHVTLQYDSTNECLNFVFS